MGFFVPLFGDGSIAERRDNPAIADAPRPPPATPEELGAAALLDHDPVTGPTLARLRRGADHAARALVTETARRGYPITHDAARARTAAALTRRDTRESP